MSEKDDSTYRSVRDRYSAYREENPRPRSRSAIGMPEVSDDVLRMVGTVVGVVVGLGLLGLAGVAYSAASRWSDFGRDGAAVAYTLTTFFLVVAGLGSIIATLNHNFRVVVSEPEHH